MHNDNTRESDGSSILTDRDLIAAIKSVNQADTTDPLQHFPVLQRYAVHLCDSTVIELFLNGVPRELATRSVGRMYALVAVGALAVHHACLHGFLPGDGADLA